MSLATRDKKRKLQFETYKKLLGYTCAHPECNNGKNIEAHHVRPLSKGGTDAFWNIIALCWTCHHTKHLHSKSEEKLVELYVFKSMHEARILGFYCDEQEEGFKEKFSKAIKENKEFSPEERLIALNYYA
jgi:hypothetical protein